MLDFIYVFSMVDTHINIYYDVKEKNFIGFASASDRSKEFIYPFGLSLLVTPIVRLMDNTIFLNHNYLLIIFSLVLSFIVGIILQKKIFKSVYKKTLKQPRKVIELSKEEFLSNIQDKLKLFTNGLVVVGIFVLVFLIFMYQNSNLVFFFFSQLGTIFIGTIISGHIMTVKNRNDVIRLKKW